MTVRDQMESIHFSVILNKETRINNEISDKSVVMAAKPLIYFAASSGIQMIKYDGNKIMKITKYRKLHSVMVTLIMLTLVVAVTPSSWLDTRNDLPLHILTKTYTSLIYAEVLFAVFVSCFCNSVHYVQLFQVIDDLDKHFRLQESGFLQTRLLTICMAVMPLLQLTCTFLLRQFCLSNFGLHFAFYLAMVQGAVIAFIVLTLYFKIRLLNYLLGKKLNYSLRVEHGISLKTTNKLQIFSISGYINSNDKHKYCWLELMQLYDKICDSNYIFNKIYASQVLFMFLSWLVCTLLTICRSLSPSLKYTELRFSDMFLYTCLNGRPFLLAVMCELLVRERNNTVNLLLHHLVNDNVDAAYLDQVQAMVELVHSRKLEISANIFPVNIPTVIHFAARAISYVVLIIQYFYIHILKKDK